MPRTLVETFDQLIDNLKYDIESGDDSLYIGDKNIQSIFERLLVMPLVREIDGSRRTFLAVRDVKLKPDFRGKGYFSKFLDDFEALGINIMFHDVVNHHLRHHLKSRGFKEYIEYKNGSKLISFYKVKERT